MSGCNCKKGANILNEESLKNEEIKINGNTILTYGLKFFGFLILLVLLPIINVYIIWLMFKMIVLNKNIDLKPLLLAIGDKFMEKTNEGDEISMDEFDSYNEDDVILLDSQEIINEEID